MSGLPLLAGLCASRTVVTRYIVIDNRSGYVVADTDDRTSQFYRMDDPPDLVRQIARRPILRVASLGPHDEGCRVYRGGNIQIQDCRNAHVIETLEQECPLVMTVRFE